MAFAKRAPAYSQLRLISLSSRAVQCASCCPMEVAYREPYWRFAYSDVSDTPAVDPAEGVTSSAISAFACGLACQWSASASTVSSWGTTGAGRPDTAAGLTEASVARSSRLICAASMGDDTISTAHPAMSRKEGRM